MNRQDIDRTVRSFAKQAASLGKHLWAQLTPLVRRLPRQVPPWAIVAVVAGGMMLLSCGCCCGPGAWLVERYRVQAVAQEGVRSRLRYPNDAVFYSCRIQKRKGAFVVTGKMRGSNAFAEHLTHYTAEVRPQGLGYSCTSAHIDVP